MTTLRRLEHFSKKISIPWRLSDVSKYLWQVFEIFQKYPTKMVLCDFRKVTEVSDKN